MATDVLSQLWTDIQGYICFPFDRKMSNQSTSGEGIATGAGCSNVADTASAAISGDQRICGNTLNLLQLQEPKRRNVRPLKVQGSLNIVWCQEIPRKCRIFRRNNKSILASWRSNTEQFYSCSWRRLLGVQRMAIKP